MKYFKIKDSIDRLVIGETYPQSQRAVHKISIEDENHLWNQKHGFLGGHVSIPDIELNNLAKQTDLISDVTFGGRLCISNKLKKIIERNASGAELQFLKTSLVVKKQQIDYWVLNPVIFRDNFIDFEHSTIWVEGLGCTKLRRIEISNYQEFLNIKKSLVSPERLAIHDIKLMGDITQKVFLLYYLSDASFCFVSEEVKNEIEKEGCTGIDFVMVD